MPRDYAASNSRSQRQKSHRNQTRRRTNSKPRPQPRQPAPRTPGWVWLFCGLTLGLLIAIGVYIYVKPVQQGKRQVTRQPVPQSTQGQQRTAKASPPASHGLPPREKPRFDFYDMLPKYQVVIPREQYRTKQQKESPKVTKPGHYVIQVGSFKDHSSADSVKARLALIGLEANIKKARLQSGQTWYRVRLGPENSTRKVNAMLKRLKAHDIDSMVMKIKG